MDGWICVKEIFCLLLVQWISRFWFIFPRYCLYTAH